jgi:hypothetical protein
MNIDKHSGSKYTRTIHSAVCQGEFVTVDVYAVLVAFDVRCPARQHAIKKLLCAGIRGKSTEEQDLREARDSISRAIELATNRNPSSGDAAGV